ncbi:MAG: ABC transporter substrate-binding protein [bacterium]|nr:ABC transporter substrate-binding protein [bacterium]
MNSRIICFLILLLSIFPVFSSEIKIGMSAAFSGPTRALGIELYRGTMAYINHINENNGVHGRKIKIIAYDDGYNPLPAVENTIRLIEKDDVFLLFNYVGTPTVTRMLPLLKMYESKHMYLFFPFTGAQSQREAPYADFVFNLRASYRQEIEGLVDNFVGLGRERIAIFYQADAYGRSGWDGLRRALKKFELIIVGEATYRRGTTYGMSMEKQVRILKRARPDAVISVGAYAACAAFIRDVRKTRWNVPIANVSFVDSANLLKLLREIGKKEGIDLTKNLVNSEVVPGYNESSMPVVSQYRKLMDKYNVLPPKKLVKKRYVPNKYCSASFEGFLNAKLLVEILERLGPEPERKNIKAVVEGIKKYDIGLNTWISFEPEKHQALDNVYYRTVEKDRFVPVRDWKRWEK